MEEKINSIKWNFRRKFIRSTLLDEGVETSKKIKQSIISVVFAFALGAILLSILGFNPFAVFYETFKSVFVNKSISKQALFRISILGLSSLSAIVAFKTGVINIGIAGQMMMGGAVTLAISISIGNSIPNGVGQILAIIIGVSLGALFAVMAALLKIFFKISEVVSTILLNWIAFYLVKFIFSKSNESLLSFGGHLSKDAPSHFQLAITPGGVIICTVIMILILFITWFVINRTSFGYSLKLTGNNIEAAKYSGINTTKNIILSMAISGGIAGMLGLVMYMSYQPLFEVPLSDTIPAEGFDGLAIAIVSFNNPVAIVPLILLFGILKEGIVTAAVVAPGITPNFINFLLGLIMYSAAISAIYLRIKPIQFFRRLIKGKENFDLWKNYKNQKLEIDKIYFEKYQNAKEEGPKYQLIQKHMIELQHLKKKYEIPIKPKGED